MLLSLCWRCRRRVDRFAFRIASGASSLFGATPSCSAAPCPYPIALSYRYRFVRERPPVHALAVVQGLKAASKPYYYHAKAGKENIWTIPNLISFSRISLAPYLGYLVYTESFPLACGLFALAGLSDLFDGFIARRFKNQSSVLGSVLDPLADKCLISVLCVSLSAVGLIPVPLVALIVARDTALIAGSFYIRYISLAPPITLSRYFDIQHASAQVTPTLFSKVNTALQLGLVALSMAAPLAGCVDHPFLHALWYTTGFTTVMSGLSYISKLGGFKILKQKKN